MPVLAYKIVGILFIVALIISFPASRALNNSTIPAAIFFVAGLVLVSIGDLLLMLRTIYGHLSKK